jgi:hypothetical protein
MYMIECKYYVLCTIKQNYGITILKNLNPPQPDLEGCMVQETGWLYSHNPWAGVGGSWSGIRENTPRPGSAQPSSSTKF